MTIKSDSLMPFVQEAFKCEAKECTHCKTVADDMAGFVDAMASVFKIDFAEIFIVPSEGPSYDPRNHYGQKLDS